MVAVGKSEVNYTQKNTKNMTGIISTLKTVFGFIVPDDPQFADIFFHRTAVVDRLRRLKVGDRVKFEIGEHDGRPCAVRIEIAPAPVPTPDNGGAR